MNIKIFQLLLIIAAIAVVGCGKGSKKVFITGHRGASGLAPENTIASMVKAMIIGADFSELDVQETADGKLIILHDKTLERTTDQDGNIWEKTFAELQGVDAGSWFSEEFKGEPIPTLKAIMDTVRGKMKLNIELKMNGHEKKLTERVVAMVEEENFIQHCILTSFDFAAIKKVKQLDNKIRVGYIFYKMPEDEDVFTANVDLLSVNKKLVDKEFVKKAHANNKEVHAWTVNEPEDMRRLIAMGVDNIITNYPDVLKEILEEK